MRLKVFVLGVLATGLLACCAPALAAGGEFTLPDGRAYELVTPVNKEGVAVKPWNAEGGVIEASEVGDAFTYLTTGAPVPEAEGGRAFEAVQNLARREGGGWVTRNIATANDSLGVHVVGSKNAEYLMFAGDLKSALVSPSGETRLSPLQGKDLEPTIFQRDNSTNLYTPLVTEANVFGGVPFDPARGVPGELRFDGASSDLAAVVVSSKQDLTSEVTGPSRYENLYEVAGGKLQLVSILPNGHPASEPGEGLIPAGAALGDEFDAIAHSAVTTGGARVIWQAHRGHLYLRDLASRETVQLDVVQSGEGFGEVIPEFQGASGDGSRVYFLDTQRLTADSHASASASRGEPDLYVAEVQGSPMRVTVTDLSKDAHEGEDAAVRGNILGYGESAGDAWVYYVANGALSPGSSPGECTYSNRKTASCTLYVQRYDASQTSWLSPRVVARVFGEDLSDWNGPQARPTTAGETARVSPDGRFLVFMSEESLTGYDNRDAVTGVRDQEVYLFDAASGGLRCVSCNPSGVRPVGVLDPFGANSVSALLVDPDPAPVWEGLTLAGSVPGWDPYEELHALYQPRYVSDSGRVFFDSPDALVPADGNGVEDVYEYEPEGAAGAVCNPGVTSPSEVYVDSPLTRTEAAEGPVGAAPGCLGLISSGKSSEESVFLDASESGSDVFFLTTSQLASQDTDDAYDIYDAHVCTAESPCPPGAGDVPPACTDADSCRGAPAAQPTIFGPGASATFSGAGNAGGREPNPAAVAPKPAVKTLTRAQKLAIALKACRKLGKRGRRSACEKSARKRYAQVARKRAKI